MRVGGHTHRNNKIIQIKKIQPERRREIFIKSKIGRIKECLRHRMQDPFHDFQVPGTRVETTISPNLGIPREKGGEEGGDWGG